MTDMAQKVRKAVNIPILCGGRMADPDINEQAIADGKTEHEGSGLSSFDSKLSNACHDSEVLDGLAVRGNDAQNDRENVRQTVNSWLNGLGY